MRWRINCVIFKSQAHALMRGAAWDLIRRISFWSILQDIILASFRVDGNSSPLARRLIDFRQRAIGAYENKTSRAGDDPTLPSSRIGTLLAVLILFRARHLGNHVAFVRDHFEI